MDLLPSSYLLLFSLCSLCLIANSDDSTTQMTLCSESDAYHKLNFVLNPNGTLTLACLSPPSPDPNLHISVLSKDFPINPSKHTWLRIFVPRNALPSNKKLPLVIFFHGDGFISLRFRSTHNLWRRSSALPSLAAPPSFTATIPISSGEQRLSLEPSDRSLQNSFNFFSLQILVDPRTWIQWVVEE